MGSGEGVILGGVVRRVKPPGDGVGLCRRWQRSQAPAASC